MYIFNSDQYKPEKAFLDRCHRVDGNGDRHNPKLMRDWAREHCESFVWWELTDMSDLSSWQGPDNYCSYYFSKNTDATAFRLRWM